MIHYHGTPIGGSKIEAAKFLVGRHGLVSFAYKDQLSAVMEYCQSFIIDNGAFTHWKKGGKINRLDYANWVNGIYKHPNFDWCIIPDVIDGSEQENMDQVEWWQENCSHIKSAPVWHLHESFDYLEFLSSRFEVVCLGSSGEWSTPNTKPWWDRISKVMDFICDVEGRPPCKFHGLRMLDHDVFTRLPLSSADSTNAAVNQGSLSRFGIYTPPTSGQRAAVIANRIEQYNSSPTWVNLTQTELF